MGIPFGPVRDIKAFGLYGVGDIRESHTVFNAAHSEASIFKEQVSRQGSRRVGVYRAACETMIIIEGAAPNG
jgi:hypothetical protein